MHQEDASITLKSLPVSPCPPRHLGEVLRAAIIGGGYKPEYWKTLFGLGSGGSVAGTEENGFMSLVLVCFFVFSLKFLAQPDSPANCPVSAFTLAISHGGIQSCISPRERKPKQGSSVLVRIWMCSSKASFNVYKTSGITEMFRLVIFFFFKYS